MMWRHSAALIALTISLSVDGLSTKFDTEKPISAARKLQVHSTGSLVDDRDAWDAVSEGRAPNLTACTERDGRWPSPLGKNGGDKIDLVISWWAGEPQPPLKEENATESSLMDEDDDIRRRADTFFEHQSEIKYMLRSFEKFGLLDYIRNVVLLIDSDIVKQFGAPRFFDYGSKRMRIVTDKDMGFDDTGYANKWVKRLNMHDIPGISDYFLYTPDDDLMIKKFKPEQFYDGKSGKPIIYDYGQYVEGWCDDKRTFGTGHGPVLINKCAMSAVAGIYKNQGWLTGGVTKGKKVVDSLCLYSNWMSTNWIYVDARDTFRNFFQECHTNGGCHTKYLQAVDRVTFINVQGTGVSDEYPPDAVEHEDLASYLHKNFPTPSRFEIAA